MSEAQSKDGPKGNLQAKITFGLAAIVVVTLLFFAWFISSLPAERFISVSIIALGLSGGMIAGTALSPSDEKESSRFTTFGQALTAFAGGYLASKLDPVITSAIASKSFADPSPVIIFRLLAFAATLLAVGKATFSCRSYDR